MDTLDHSIYLKTDNKAIYILLDNTFICDGLLSKPLDLTEVTNDYEQIWDVSSDDKWQLFIGRKIVDLKILWRETWTSNLDGSNKVYTTYPQTFEIKTENGKSIFITASELKDNEDEYYSQMDNLLVTTNYELLQRLENIEQKEIEKHPSKRTIWKRLFQ